MLHIEFEERTKATVGFYFYHKVIEKMYNALPDDMDKDEFCKMLDPKGVEYVQKLYYARHPEEDFSNGTL